MLPTYFAPQFFPEPTDWKDVLIYVDSYNTEKEMRGKAASIACGGHYKFVRFFVEGVEQEPSKHDGAIPEAGSLVKTPVENRKKGVEILEERAKNIDPSK